MIVRNSRPADIEAILAIKCEPNVAKQQYSFNQTEYASWLSRVLTGDNVSGIFTTQFSTIEDDGAIIGYVRHDHYSMDGTKMVQCSFNLASAFWGQGKMKWALKQLVTEWISVGRVQHVFADHFRTNARCENLLTGLSFDRQHVSMVEQVRTVLQQRCLRWIVRRRLDAPKWTTTANGIAM